MKIKYFIIAGILLCLIAAKSIEQNLLKTRKGFYPKTTVAVRPKVKPMEIIGTVILGGLRVFVVDALWMKVIDHEESGEFHEVLLTSELISDLQPTYSSVWGFLCNLMSVQIPSEEKDIETQIEWIKVGLSYVQKGIDRNPELAKLYLIYARTVYRRLALSHGRNNERYYLVRRSGLNPLPIAREYVLKAIETNNYTVFSERQLFIVNAQIVKESFFHFRRVYVRKFKFLRLMFDNFLEEGMHSKEEIVSSRNKYEKYKKEFGEESSFETIQKKITIDLEDIKKNIGKYPAQFDFEQTLETHRKAWKPDIFLIKDFLHLDGYLKEMISNKVKGKLSKNENKLCLLYIDKSLLEFKMWDIRNNSDLIPLRKQFITEFNALTKKVVAIKKEMENERKENKK